MERISKVQYINSKKKKKKFKYHRSQRIEGNSHIISELNPRPSVCRKSFFLFVPDSLMSTLFSEIDRGGNSTTSLLIEQFSTGSKNPPASMFCRLLKSLCFDVSPH